jgi:antitoxin component of RelBE/YafQ-DinJ toxin-antitoxin module
VQIVIPPDPVRARDPRVSVRIDDDLKTLVKEVVEKTGITETTLVEASLRALCDYYQEHGEITLPLVVLPKSQAEKITPISAVEEPSLRAAETAPKYTGKRSRA